MSGILSDPWSDAADIAARLARPSARLVLIVGAESWCATCRTLRPIFEDLAAQHVGHDDVWLWLDLEDHAEFLDNLIPDSLPLLVAYKGSHLTHAVVPQHPDAAQLAALLARRECIEQAAMPDLRTRLMAPDWAA